MKNEPFPKSIGHHRGAPQSPGDAEGELNLGTQTGLLAVAMVPPAKERLPRLALSSMSPVWLKLSEETPR